MKAKCLIESQFDDLAIFDLAVDFIEEEVGQFDWLNNLRTLWRDLGDDGVEHAISKWLDATGRAGDAKAIHQSIKLLFAEHSPHRTPWQQLVRPPDPNKFLNQLTSA